MKKLLKDVAIKRVHGLQDRDISAVEFDSRKSIDGSMFVAVRGTQVDGHNYIERAIDSGAVVVVCEQLPELLRDEVSYIEVEDSAQALGLIATAFYGHPSRRLRLVGVTGTNGKTTTATLLHDLFTRLGYKVGLISTVVNRVAQHEMVSTHTTPDPVTLNRLLNEMVECGCEFCFMEVSSHSVVQRRIAGLHFAGGIFTNLTHDHLDYHKTFAEYLRAKKQFFDELPSGAFALTNIDDRNGEIMLQNCKARHRSYSLRTMADYHGRLLESHLDGMLMELNGRELWVRFIGRFNGYNLTAIYGTAIELGATPEEILPILSTLHPVAGRFETLRSTDGRLGVVDYAHTPDALQNVLYTISELKGSGKVITVVGCGGDRDATKRPVMAKIAAQMSDRVILTSDNPRTEDPHEILKQMNTGLDPVDRAHTLTISDRREAIRTAVALASSGDVVLVAGKGHETYQEVCGIRHHFDDREELREAMGL